MGREIIWTAQGEQDIDEIMLYFKNEFSEQTAVNFWNKVVEKIEFISKYPETGQKSLKNDSVRFARIEKRWRLY